MEFRILEYVHNYNMDYAKMVKSFLEIALVYGY